MKKSENVSIFTSKKVANDDMSPRGKKTSLKKIEESKHFIYLLEQRNIAKSFPLYGRVSFKNSIDRTYC